MKRVKTLRIHAGQRGPRIVCGVKDALMPVSNTTAFVYERDLDDELLARSLSSALSAYPIFSARFRAKHNRLVLDCDDSGVQLEVFQHDQTLKQSLGRMLLGRKRESAPDVHTGWDRPDTAMRVRVTHFRGGGTILGVATNHAVGDLRTIVNLMNGWSKLADGRAHETLPMMLDRDAFMREHTHDGSTPSEQRLLRAREFPGLAVYLAKYLLRPGLLSLHFTADEVATMHAEIQQRAQGRISPNDALLSHLMTCFDAAMPRPSGRTLMIAINWRPALGLPDTTLGNFASMLSVHCASGASPQQLAVELNETRRAWAPNYHSLARFFDAAGGLSRAFRMVPTGVDPLAGSIAISNCDRSGYYDTTFGGVAPVYVHSRSAAVPSFGLLSDGWGNHGRELNLQLQAAEVARMSQPAMLAALHRYRAPGDTDAVKEHLPWLQ